MLPTAIELKAAINLIRNEPATMKCCVIQSYCHRKQLRPHTVDREENSN